MLNSNPPAQPSTYQRSPTTPVCASRRHCRICSHFPYLFTSDISILASVVLPSFPSFVLSARVISVPRYFFRCSCFKSHSCSCFRLLYFSIDLHFVFYVVSLFMCYFVFMHFVLHDAFSLFAYSAQPLGFHFVMHCFITFVVFHVCSSTLIFSSFKIT